MVPTPYYTDYGYTPFHESPPGSPGLLWIDIPNAPYWASLRGNPGAYQPALNQAYKKFVQRSRDDISADMLTNAAEWNKTCAMIVNRVKPMIDFVKALRNPKRFSDSSFRRGQFRARRLARAREGQPKPTKLDSLDKGKSKLAGWYLEEQFGWAPTVDDIVSGVKSLGRDLPIGLVKGHGRIQLSSRSGSNPLTENFADIRVNCGAKVSIVNPNFALLDCLGLANPGLTAWNLLPFSFLADWAFDVSAQLSAWSDLFGYNIVNPYYSAKSDSTCRTTWSTPHGGCTVRGGWLVRRIGLIAPKANFHVMANLHQSVHRAALSLALLGSVIRRSK